MRELGFRAFIKPLGRYATGLDTIQFHKCCDVAGAGIWTVVTVNEGIFEGDDIIVEQDTGLKDKNGKEICKGDIVRCHGDDRFIASVIRHDNSGGFCWVSCYKEECFIPESDEVEVIGNIHENGDLLND